MEGDAEKFLLPTLARLHDETLDFDAMGITVCSIAGTNFSPYIRLLGPNGLDIPFVVLTDFDPKVEDVSQEDADPDDDAVGDSYGERRIVNQIINHLIPNDDRQNMSSTEILETAKGYGIFLNNFTFEIDLFKAGAANEFAEAIKELTSNKKMKARFDALFSDPGTLNPKQFLKDIDSLGKGRVAQRLASVLIANNVDVCPPYIQLALAYLKAKLT